MCGYFGSRTFYFRGILMDALAIQIGLAILETVSLEIGKKGFKRIKRVLTKDLLDKSVLEMTKQRQYKGFDSDELLRVVLYKEDQIFKQLNRVIEELNLRTKVRTDGKTITLDVSPKDFKKINCVAEISRSVPEEKEIALLVNQVKQYFKVVTPVIPQSPVFIDWFERKCGKNALFFEISAEGYYSISRSQANTQIKRDLRWYIVDTTDWHNYIYNEVEESQELSDKNSIVIKSSITKGYIIAVSGTL